jgi:hypothetical protein
MDLSKGKHASLFLRAIIKVFIRVIFLNVIWIEYLDRTFNEKQNDINFKMK